MKHLIFLIGLMTLSACAGVPTATNAPLTLKAVSFGDLPGWGADDLTQAAPALKLSCARILKNDANAAFGGPQETGSYGDWASACADFANVPNNSASLREFFEARFQPYEAGAGGNPQGLFTGYYEASLHGSYTQNARYRYPLYGRPGDLVMVDLGEFRPELKGQRIAGRVQDGNLKPFEDRAAIVAGKLPPEDKPLLWVDSAVDAFFTQVQGSGIVEMDDGTKLGIGYAAQNGWPYYAIGKELVKRGELTRDNVSMQAIRDWLENHPDEAEDVMNANKSYVFFKTMDGGPIGGAGVALTPGRSLAIDHGKIPYGVPVWLATENPPLQRLMMAQDTGGAIIGAVRGDVFWGYGPQAEAAAGPMKSPGRYWLLLPKRASV